MLSTHFIRTICRADVDEFDHLADRTSNKKLLQKLLRTSKPVSRSGDGTIWHHEAADTGVFYFVTRKAPDTICLYMPCREIVLAPGLSALEVRSWQSTILGGAGQGMAGREGRGIRHASAPQPAPVVSSERLTRSGSHYWEDRVGQHHPMPVDEAAACARACFSYQEQWSWFAPEHLGRNGSSRFFIERTRSDTQRQTVGKEA